MCMSDASCSTMMASRSSIDWTDAAVVVTSFLSVGGVESLSLCRAAGCRQEAVRAASSGSTSRVVPQPPFGWRRACASPRTKQRGGGLGRPLAHYRMPYLLAVGRLGAFLDVAV